MPSEKIIVASFKCREDLHEEFQKSVPKNMVSKYLKAMMIMYNEGRIKNAVDKFVEAHSRL